MKLNPNADGILCIIIARNITNWNMFSFFVLSAYDTQPNETPSAIECTTRPIRVTNAFECYAQSSRYILELNSKI